MSQIFRFERVLTPQAVLAAAEIEVDDGRITGVRECERADGRFAGLWAVPGYVDTHCHGGAGVDFADPDAQAVARAIGYHRSQGSTSIIASTVTEPLDVLVEQVKRLRPLVEAGELVGIHLEGPFLAEAKKGAHEASLLRAPHHDYVAPLIEAGGGTVKMVTLAPELEHGMDSIRQFIAGGVKVAFGHSDADADTTRRSIEQGACIATHLFNAMRGIHHREPGPVPELLHDPRVMVELVCDGVHLHPSVIAMAMDAAGTGRVALVTDAMSATGQPDGDYVLGALRVEVKAGVARLVTEDGRPGSIAGSTLTMAKAV
ncbi:MAG: amidohydrolase family protein, partial [Propionibacteriaceae bacterium]|nr:amidohydrolase family protein [Propionibacteriaceae bacterium]